MAYMQKYSVTFFGTTSLLMHKNSIPWRENMTTWRMDPANKQKSIAGDDRTPAFRWLGYMYTESQRVVLPIDNVKTMIREAATLIPLRGNVTHARMAQSGIQIPQTSWPFLVNGVEIPFGPDQTGPLVAEQQFTEHEKAAEKMGFSLFTKPVTIGTSSHIRVRPEFRNWSCSGEIFVIDDRLTTQLLKVIFGLGGTRIGLCDWRLSTSHGGGHGLFTATIKKAK